MHKEIASKVREIKASPLDAPATSNPRRSLPLIRGVVKDEASEREDRVLRSLAEDVRLYISQRYAALVSSDRDLEASRVADVLLTGLDDELSRIALVTQAVAAGVAQEHTERHVRWLNEAMK